MHRTLLAAASILALGLPTSAQAEKWDMPLAYAASNYHSENAAEFATCVGERTGGELEIVPHPSGSLFGGDAIKRAVQTGQAPIGERLLSAHQNENPLFGVDAVPFLATSFEASDKLWEAATPEIEKLLDEENLVYLYAVPWPPQGLYANKAIGSVEDMRGLKFRAYNPATSRLAELAEMQPVQIEAAELSQALATGVAEAFVSSGSTGYDRKVWEQLSNFYTVDAWLPRNTVFANKDAWNDLSDEAKEAVRTCADEAAERGTQKAEELTQFYVDELQKAGMTVEEAGEQLRSDLEAIGATMTDEWLSEAGDEGKAIVDAYNAM